MTGKGLRNGIAVKELGLALLVGCIVLMLLLVLLQMLLLRADYSYGPRYSSRGICIF